MPGLPHHVVTRGNNRRRLYSYPRDYHTCLRYLLIALSEVACVIHQITLMANHIHMIVTPETVEALSKLMQSFKYRYAMHRNRVRQGSGHLFDERYWSKPIKSMDQLRLTTAYNDTNFYRDARAADPFEHRWSTVGLHAGKPKVDPKLRELWTPSDWYRNLGGTADERAAAYREYIVEYLETKELPQSLEGCWWLDELFTPYTKRLERPNRTRAREKLSPYKLRGSD